MNKRSVSAETSASPARAPHNAARSADERAFLEALVPGVEGGELGASDHVVQLYQEEAHLLEAVSRFAGAGLEAGEAAVLIATTPHLDRLAARLRARGLDLASAGQQGQYIGLDAAQALSKIMVDGCPHEGRFIAVVGDLIARASARYPRVRVFGEMVALLWADGYGDAALQIEGLWNDLVRNYGFSLFCAYPMGGFARAGHAEQFRRICQVHSRVIPAEGYTALASPDERLRVIAQLQQKAQALEAEVAERRALEQSLRRSERELADFFDNAPMGLHWAGPDGLVQRVNQAELNLLGYSREEYLGHHIAEFHADPQASADILRRLHAGEELHDYEARLRCKDGSIKHVLIDANVLWEGSRFIHTRCFTRDITAQKRAEAAVSNARRNGRSISPCSGAWRRASPMRSAIP